jgi:hypothetical protein
MANNIDKQIAEQIERLRFKADSKALTVKNMMERILRSCSEVTATHPEKKLRREDKVTITLYGCDIIALCEALQGHC